MFPRNIPLFLIAVLLTASSTVLPQSSIYLGDDEILARIGPKTITVRDFTERLELMPWPGMEHPATQDSARVKAFLSLVAEKLLALQATDLGMVVNTGNSSVLQAMERGLARDQLFRQEIRGSVTITPDDLDTGLKRLSHQMKVGIFRMYNEASARALAMALSAQRDSLPPPIPVEGILEIDSLTLTFGDLHRQYEDTIYTLKLFEAKPSYAPGRGWMVFHLLDASVNPSYVQWTMQERINAVRRKVEKAKEREQSSQYLRSRFSEQIRMDSLGFHLLTDTLLAIMHRDPAVKQEDGNYSVTSTHLDMAKKSLEGQLQRVIIASGGDDISLGELIDELRFHPTRFASLNSEQVEEQFNASLRQAGQAALVSEDAISKGYHQHPDVQRDLNVWVDALGAQRLLKHIVDSLGERQANSADSLSASAVRGRETFKAINEYIMDLAKRFGPEVYTEKLRRVKVGASNMVTRRHFGFGGSMTAMPMLMRFWDWYEAWQLETVASP